MELTIAKITDNIWKSGILHSTFVFTNGATGEIKAGIYRSQRLDKETVTVRGIGWRNFALASMPVEWEPRIGDTVTVHPSQL